MERINYSPLLTRHIVKKGLLKNDPLCLVDVGASGGISSHWNVFNEFIKGFGFEPLIAECERLNKDKHKSPNVTYYPYTIIADEPEVHAETGPHYFSHLFNRTSATKAAQLKKLNYVQHYFNSGQEVVYSKEQVSLDQFFSKTSVETIDFIKIDTDGHDYEVLYGAKKLLRQKQVLGIEIESSFHGKSHPHSNTFRNIDRFLTDNGFSLFDLEVYRYTKQDLPGTFAYRIPAQTLAGQALWGEALYFRDCGGQNQSFFKDDLSPTKLLKLACLLELFGLPDCTAELLNIYKDKLSSFINIQESLDLLVKDMGFNYTYADHMKKFEANFEDFYLSKKKKFWALCKQAIGRRF